MDIPNDFIIRGPPCITLESRSLGEYMVKQLEEHGDKVSQIDAHTGKKQLFSEILNKSRLLGASLRSLGVKPNDVVGICSENSLDYSPPVLAILLVGATCAPYNASYTPREFRHALDLTKPKVVFCSESVEDVFTEAVSDREKIKVIVMGEDKRFDHHILMNTLMTSRHAEKHFVPHEIQNPTEEVAFIMCSSGTTGLPKGVMLTHTNMLFGLAVIQHPSIMNREDIGTVIGYLPFFHSFGMNGLLQTMALGLVSVVMSHFAPDVFLQIIQDYKVRSLQMVPPIIAFMTKNPMADEYDLTSLKTVGCGAAPLSRDLQDEFLRKFPNVEELRQGYGLTEATLAVLVVPRKLNKFGSSGIIVPGMEAKVIDIDRGNSLGPNKEGELCFRGCLIMKGYVNDPVSTAATIDSQGWLHTGDIGYYDEDGYFYIIDRLKELIKYKGFQVAPAELESVLMTHPAVQDAAVIGIPDEYAGELPKAFVVKKSDVTERELQMFVEKLVEYHKRLRGGIQFVDDIPKNQSGKILRRELKQQLKSKL